MTLTFKEQIIGDGAILLSGLGNISDDYKNIDLEYIISTDTYNEKIYATFSRK